MSTYRHVLAPISRCEYRGSISIDSLPPEVREELLKRGEVILTELDENLAKVLGVDNLSNYQYIRFSTYG
ncbi:MAG: hypothetical protein LM571_00905 [Desulfurococcaceae archaeon]|nr:hypothetical protein [Desulfurococcaceae archaeon]